MTQQTNRTAHEQRVLAAARAWWESKRIPGMTLKQHLANATTGTRWHDETRLARAVADWQQAEQAQPEAQKGEH